jgi:hypothetical protein
VTSRTIVAAMVGVALVTAADRAAAQTFGPGRFELAVGPQWTGGSSNGTHDATETQFDGSPLRLFSTASERGSAAGLEARVGVRLTRRLGVEATGTYTAPQLRVRVTRDTEGAPDTTAAERMQLVSVSGAVVWALTKRADPRTFPFLTGGAGWVRELHENDTFIVAGQQAYGGIGLERLLRTRERRRVKALGIRGDARVIVQSKALNVDDRVHAAAALTASLFVRF